MPARGLFLEEADLAISVATCSGLLRRANMAVLAVWGSASTFAKMAPVRAGASWRAALVQEANEVGSFG